MWHVFRISRHAFFIWDVTNSYVWYDSLLCDMSSESLGMPFSYGTWLIHMCDMTHSYVTCPQNFWACLFHMGRDSFIYVTWLIHMWHDLFMREVPCSCVTWLIHICVMPRTFVWMTHLCVTWLIYVWHDSFVCDMTHSCVIWLIYVGHDTCDMWHASLIWDMASDSLVMPDLYRTWLIFVSDRTHSCVTWLTRVWHDSFMWDMTHVTCLSHMGHGFRLFGNASFI